MLFLPLSVLLCVELLLVALLLTPWPALRSVALAVTGLCKSSTGKYVIRTIWGMLLVVLVSTAGSIWNLETRIRRQPQNLTPGATDYEVQTSCRERLEAFLTGCCLVLVIIVERLDTLIKDNDKLRVEKSALLKQSKGIQDEYLRLLNDGPPEGRDKTVKLEEELKVLKAKLLDLQEENKDLQEKVEEKTKEARAAEASVQAMKKQTAGQLDTVEQLYEEIDNLKAQLAALDSRYSKSNDKKTS